MLLWIHLVWNSIDVLNVLANALIASVFLMVAAVATRGYRRRLARELLHEVGDDLRSVVDELQLTHDVELIREGVERVTALVRLLEDEAKSSEDED